MSEKGNISHQPSGTQGIEETTRGGEVSNSHEIGAYENMTAQEIDTYDKEGKL
jgi:hypothetical protein